MKKYIKLVVLLLPLVAAGWAYASLSKKVEPRTTPKVVTNLENALASPDLVGLYYLDMDYILRLESALYGKPDPFALPTKVSNQGKANNSFLTFLGNSGLKINESVDYIVGGFIAHEKEVGNIQVALGHFPINELNQHWKQNKQVEATEISGRPAWIWTPVDPDTCKKSRPEILVAEGDRLITGDEETVKWFLQRSPDLPPAQDLTFWRNYRKGKLFGFGLFLPKRLQDISQNPFVRMLARAAQENMVPVTGIYSGATVTWVPSGVNIEMLIQSTDSAWNKEQHQTLQEWKKKTIQKIDNDFKTTKNLFGYLDSKADDKQLVLEIKINESLIKDISTVIKEGVQWFASSMSSSMSVSGMDSGSGEKTIPDDKVNHYRQIHGPKGLDPFDVHASSRETFSTTAGPFGIQLTGISIHPTENDVIELETRVTSSPIPNMEYDQTADFGEGAGAWLIINRVLDQRGRNLLREESCGRERNSKHATLHKGFRQMDIKRARKTPAIKRLIEKNSGWSTVTAETLQGTKSFRLKPGAKMSQIAWIEGEVVVQLPTQVTKHRVQAPFKDKVVEASSVRIKLKEGSPDSLSYTTSGEIDRLIDTRALNGSGKYISYSSSVSSPIMFGDGVNSDRRFHGKPKTAEFVLAKNISRETYPFKMKFKRPAGSKNDFMQSVRVSAGSKNSFMGKRYPKPKRAVCRNNQVARKEGPFYLCLGNLEFRKAWGKKRIDASGMLMVNGPNSPELTDNLSAVQFKFYRAIAQDKSSRKKTTLKGKDEHFANLSKNYTHPFKGEQLYINMGPIQEGTDNLDLLGYEGHMTIRMPRRLSSFRLDLNDLGNSVQGPDGWSARFTGIKDNVVLFDLEGPREKLVQFIPRSAKGKPLKQADAEVKRSESDENVWKAKVKVPAETRLIDIIFATKQDSWNMPFHLEKKSPQS